MQIIGSINVCRKGMQTLKNREGSRKELLGFEKISLHSFIRGTDEGQRFELIGWIDQKDKRSQSYSKRSKIILISGIAIFQFGRYPVLSLINRSTSY